jgi:aryl-alcohol dehydrogenase-like predicted oxidoreductase
MVIWRRQYRGEKPADRLGGQEDSDSRTALQKAFSVGINHWDTADVYGDGRSEQIIGAMWDEIPRNDIFIATKVGWDMGPHNHWYHPEHMRANMERSLKNLKTDCVDLMYLHHCNFGKQEQFFDDAVETIRRFQAEGKTRFIGLSDWFSDKVIKFIGEKPLSDMPVLFAKQVACENGTSEEEFLQLCFNQLSDLGIEVKKMMAGLESNIQTDVSTVHTRSLMVADLKKNESILLQEKGLGDHRLLGCGLFIPQKDIETIDN